MQTQTNLGQKIGANDISSGLLTTEQIQQLPINIVYEWVKTGKWSLSDFKKWVHAIGESK